MDADTTDSAAWIRGLIQEFLHTSQQNTMGDATGEPAWDQALVGFASGADPMWQQYKEYVGAFHWTPWEVFAQHHPAEPAGAQDLSVICWVLPQREPVRRIHRRASEYPSEEWARTRVYGEEFNFALRSHVAKSLQEAGYPAIAPMLAPNWTWVRSRKFSYASSWSERHAAHACGLGTFGLCDGLITSRGKALRVGSVVARLPVQPTKRPYSHHRAYCLYFAQGTCGKCMDRCPAGAINESGHDKEKCLEYVAGTRQYVRQTYGFEGYGCGLCQVNVPCEATIPVKEARNALEKE